MVKLPMYTSGKEMCKGPGIMRKMALGGPEKQGNYRCKDIVDQITLVLDLQWKAPGDETENCMRLGEGKYSPGMAS